MNNRKPKIGLLGLILEGYEEIFPGILERQVHYAQEIAKSLEPAADVIFAGPGLNRARIEEIAAQYNREGLDGILIVTLAYSPGAYLVRALEHNRLPLALAVVQPDQEPLEDWEELDLTVNQGIHGAQDTANAIIRGGYPCAFFVGNRRETPFLEFVRDFGKACLARSLLKNLRVGVFSRMCGMGDILADDMAFYKKIGPEICHDTIGSVYARMQGVPEAHIKAQMEKDRALLDVDPKLSPEAHAIAVRTYLGFKKYLEEKDYGAFTAHFDQFVADGRFRQLPLYAASNLMAEGYGYAAEGDFLCASIVAAAHAIGRNDGHFTEMYAMDFARKAILFCHAGEGNWAVCRKDRKPRLIDRYLGEGGLENPPTHLFTPQYGPATLTSLAAIQGETFRFVLARGEVLSKPELQRCEMPYFFWRPNSGVELCVESWLKCGGTHHQVLNLGDVGRRWEMLADMLGVERVTV
jgi:L-arabinose isomerase